MSKHNDIYNILGKLNSLQPKEESKPNILKEFAEPKSVDVVQNLNNKFKEHKQLNEYFHFDMPKGKDRGPRDTGTDELDRRSKLGKDPLIKHGAEYKQKDKHGGYKIGGPKGPLPEGEVEESGLQAYLGKKKYGKDGMQALQQAGRDGASKEKMAKIRAKHDKLDEQPNEDMLSPKQKKFAALAEPKDKITYADKIAGAKKKEEGNEFSGELVKARAQGKDSFSVDGKDYPVKENFEDQHDVTNKGEYDQEGDMAKDDLSTIEDAARELDSILSADDNLPEWVQSKINKAMDYLDTARDYMKANTDDDNPEIKEGEYKDSVNKSKVPAFQRKAKGGDWKVSTKDLDDEASKSPTGHAGLEKLKQRMRDDGVMEGFPTVADAKARAEKEKGTGKFDKQTTSTGTRYTRKPETYADDGEETSGSSDTPKKRGRPKKNTGPERVTSKAWKHKGGRKTNESIKLDTFVEDTISELDSLLLSEKAVSKAQQKFMGMVYAAKKGDKPASKEVAKAAKGMSKKDAKDFAKTKHKGLPSKVTEGINFMEMMRETDQTVEEMLNELHDELAEYKRSGQMGDKLRDALELHRHSKNKLMGENKDKENQRTDFFYNPDVPDDEQLPALPDEVEVDMELDELARLAGLGEMSRGDYIKQQDAAAERSGKDSFNAFGQNFDTDQVHEASCNMTAEGQMCPEHGFAECAGMMYEAKGKPDFLDIDKDGNKKEPMKKAAKEKQQVDECGDMSPMGSMSQSESGMSISTSVDTRTGRKTINVNADGEAAEQLAQMLKMAGLEHNHSHAEPEHKVVMIRPQEQAVAEEFANEPNEQYADTQTIVDAGQDLNRKKKQYADKPKAGDNPMATENVQLEDRLAALYDSIKVKA